MREGNLATKSPRLKETPSNKESGDTLVNLRVFVT
jgi:hypothetical protein